MTAPEPSADVQPGHDGVCGRCAHRLIPGCPDCRPAAPSEPPAEAQQDDEQLVCAEHRAAARRIVDDWIDRGHRASGPIALDELRAGIAAALASRPSADTETLPHCSTCICGKRAPVQGERENARGALRAMPPGTVTWAEHEQAYVPYAGRFGISQSAERLAERGGFGYWELTELLGHEPTTWSAR